MNGTFRYLSTKKINEFQAGGGQRLPPNCEAMMTTFTRSGLLLVGLLVVAGQAAGQIMWPTQEEFGRNRIQQQHLKWQVLTTSNFEVYFYGNNQSMATYLSLIHI